MAALLLRAVFTSDLTQKDDRGALEPLPWSVFPTQLAAGQGSAKRIKKRTGLTCPPPPPPEHLEDPNRLIE